MLTDRDDGDALTVFFDHKISARVRIIFSEAAVCDPRRIECRTGVGNARFSEIEYVIVAERDRMQTESSQCFGGAARCFQAGTELVDSRIAVGDGAFEIRNVQIVSLKERGGIGEKEFGISLFEWLP